MYPDILLIMRVTASDATTCQGNISYFDWLETLWLQGHPNDGKRVGKAGQISKTSETWNSQTPSD